jgi:hypothetical protein
VTISERDFDWAHLRVCDFGLSLASEPDVAASAALGQQVSTARLPGRVAVSEYLTALRIWPNDVRLAALMLTRDPAFALLHWMAEAVLKPILPNF